MSDFKTCDSNGVKIAYQVRGNGEPLVLIMGLGASARKWEPHTQAYEKQFRCFVIDNRGAGLSDKPEVESYSIADMARDAIAVMDAEGIDSAHVNGVSMGGAVAQYMAIHYPERVRSIILTNTFPRCNVSFRRAIEFLRDACGQTDGATFCHLCQWIIFSFDFQEKREDYLLDSEANDPDSSVPMPVHAYKAQCNAILGFDESARLKDIKCPALIMAGECDLLAPLWLVEEMRDAIPNCEMYVAPKGGHVQHWEQLENYNRITLEFLNKNRKD